MSEVMKTRDNNFAVIRLAAATMVIAGHMDYILGRVPPTLFQVYIHAVGVKIFFLTGGYLISLSWQSDTHIFRYAIKRISRIWPPLVVAVLFSALILGPILTELNPLTYIKDPRVASYILNNIFFVPTYSLPGLFTTCPYPNVVNGSLWTLPIEMVMYIAIPILLCVTRKMNDKLRFCCILSIVILCGTAQVVHVALYPEGRFVFCGTDWAQALDIIPYYFIGALFTFPHMKRLLNAQMALVLIFILACIQTSYPAGVVIMYFLLPYLVFSLALAQPPYFANRTGKHEISYGIYLYAFPIQQSVVLFTIREGLPINYMACLVISIILTVLMANFSCALVEEPIQRLSKALLRKMSDKTSNPVVAKK